MLSWMCYCLVCVWYVKLSQTWMVLIGIFTGPWVLSWNLLEGCLTSMRKLTLCVWIFWIAIYAFCVRLINVLAMVAYVLDGQESKIHFRLKLKWYCFYLIWSVLNCHIMKGYVHWYTRITRWRTVLHQVMVFSVYRSGGILRAQDLNIILRHYGNLNRWQELSQVGVLKAFLFCFTATFSLLLLITTFDCFWPLCFICIVGYTFEISFRFCPSESASWFAAFVTSVYIHPVQKVILHGFYYNLSHIS